MPSEKLNKVLATNIPMLIWMKKRAGTYDDKYNEGAKNYMYIFEDEKGVEYVHYASERQEEDLSLFKEGDALQVVRKEETNAKSGNTYKMYLFTPQEGAEAQMAATPKVMSNTAQRTMEDRHDNVEKKREIKDICICLQGYSQCRMANGESSADALKNAVLDRYELIARAHDIYAEDNAKN